VPDNDGTFRCIKFDAQHDWLNSGRAGVVQGTHLAQWATMPIKYELVQERILDITLGDVFGDGEAWQPLL
jgi:hypothetical protein